MCRYDLISPSTSSSSSFSVVRLSSFPFWRARKGKRRCAGCQRVDDDDGDELGGVGYIYIYIISITSKTLQHTSLDSYQLNGPPVVDPPRPLSAPTMITLDLSHSQPYTWSTIPIIILPFALLYVQVYLLLKYGNQTSTRLLRAGLLPLGIWGIIKAWLGHRVMSEWMSLARPGYLPKETFSSRDDMLITLNLLFRCSIALEYNVFNFGFGCAAVFVSPKHNPIPNKMTSA